MSELGAISLVESKGASPTSLRIRLFLLVLLLVLPTLGLVIHGHLERRRIETAHVRERAIALSQLAAAQEENFVQNTRQLLTTLAEIPFLVLSRDAAATHIHLANLRTLLPDYLNFGLIETNGRVFCSAASSNAEVDLSDRAYFRRVLETKTFATGDFMTGRITRSPTLNFGYPVAEGGNGVARIIYAALKIQRLSEVLTNLSLPPEASVTVIDRNGNVLARQPEAESWVGRALQTSPAVQRLLTEQRGAFEMSGMDGVRQLHAVTPVAGGKTPSMFAWVEIPVSVSFAPANATLIMNLVIVLLVAVAIFGLGWVYTQRVILLPVHSLVQAARQLATGNYAARAVTANSTSELRQLGTTINEMAQKLQARQLQVEQAQREVRSLNEDLERRVAQRTAELAAANSVLHHERHLWKTLMDNVPTDIYFKDLDSRFLRNNRAHAKRFGLADPSAARGKSDADFFSAEHASQTRRDELQVIRSGQPIAKEEMETWPDGSRTWVSTVKLPLPDEQGKIVGTFGISHDITGRKQAEEAIQQLNQELQRRAAELEDANRELASFSYSVSHDLRAPLRGIDGLSLALEEDYGPKLDATGKDYLVRVRKAVQRMAELIDDLLKLSQIARAEVQRQPIDLKALAVSIAQELQARDPQRTIEWMLADDLTATGDHRLLRVVLENLLGNAWKFTGQRAVARIEVGRLTQDGKTVFCVRDNGAGFDMAYAAKLFGAFQRLHTQSEFEGTGIGLATVQRIIHRHGGRIWAEAEVEKGATFYFTLEP